MSTTDTDRTFGGFFYGPYADFDNNSYVFRIKQISLYLIKKIKS